MERLATAIIRAAQIREDSWDQEAFDALKTPEEKCMTAFDFYRRSLKGACAQAAEEAGFGERGVKPIHLMLKNSWNLSLEWAKKYNALEPEKAKDHKGWSIK